MVRFCKHFRLTIIALPLSAALILAVGPAVGQNTGARTKARVIAQVSGTYIGQLAWCGVDIDEIKTYYEQRIAKLTSDEDERQRVLRALDLSVAKSLRASASSDNSPDSCTKIRAAGWQAFRKAIDQFVGG